MSTVGLGCHWVKALVLRRKNHRIKKREPQWEWEMSFLPQNEGSSNPNIVYLHLTKWGGPGCFRTLDYFCHVTWRPIELSTPGRAVSHCQRVSQTGGRFSATASAPEVLSQEAYCICTVSMQYCGTQSRWWQNTHSLVGEISPRELWLASWHAELKLCGTHLHNSGKRESLQAGLVEDRNWALMQAWTD